MKVTLIAGDICDFSGDAIVNPANNRGLGGGGADGAIHRAAGPGLKAACENLPIYEGLKGYSPGLKPINDVRVPNGSAIPTPAFDLPCRWVIHTAGPVWPDDPDKEVFEAELSSLAGMQMKKMAATKTTAGTVARAVLRNCYKMPLFMAIAMGMKSIAFPAISTGVYGCPVETCAEVVLQFCKTYIKWPIDVTIVLYPAINLPIWQAIAEDLIDVPVTVDMD